MMKIKDKMKHKLARPICVAWNKNLAWSTVYVENALKRRKFVKNELCKLAAKFVIDEA